MFKILSIVVPYYRGEEFIFTLLNSLKDSYNYSRQNLKVQLIIIIDSLPINDTIVDKMRSYNVFEVHLIINKVNIGVAKSRDLGLQESSGDYVTFIDQDDFVSINYFPSLEKILGENSDLYIMNGYLYDMQQNISVVMFPLTVKFDLNNFIYNNVIPTPSFLLLNRSMLIKYHITFSSEGKIFYPGVDDWGFILSLLLRTNSLSVGYIKSKNVYYCIHSSNYSLNIDRMIDSAIDMLSLFSTIYNLNGYLINTRINAFYYAKLFYKYRRKSFCKIMSCPRAFCSFIYFQLKDKNRFCRFIFKKLTNTNLFSIYKI